MQSNLPHEMKWQIGYKRRVMHHTFGDAEMAEITQRMQRAAEEALIQALGILPEVSEAAGSVLDEKEWKRMMFAAQLAQIGIAPGTKFIHFMHKEKLQRMVAFINWDDLSILVAPDTLAEWRDRFEATVAMHQAAGEPPSWPEDEDL